MDNKKMVPEIRFPGFTDPWEQRKFGDENDLLTGYPFESEKYVEEGITLIRGMNVKRGYLDLSDEICMKWSSSEGLESYLLEDGDILIQMDGALIGKSYARIAQYQLPALLVQRVTRARTKKDIANSDFMYQTIQRNFLSYIKMNKTETAVPHLSLNDIRDFIIMVPSLAEQRKIGEYFTNIDNLITLHQRKLNEIKDFKKGMLQKMFPKSGERFPEIRFPGFTDPWEQRKLGDIFIEYSEKRHEELPPLTIIQGGGTILRDESERVLQYDKSNLSGYKMVKKDDFIVHLRSFEGGLEKANTDGIISPAYHTFHGDSTDTRFYYPFFRSKHFIDILLKPHVYGIRDGRSIDIEGMKTIKIPVPSLDEQHCIGDFLECLDNLITLHQRKLDEMKELKKGLLQKMFI